MPLQKSVWSAGSMFCLESSSCEHNQYCSMHCVLTPAIYHKCHNDWQYYSYLFHSVIIFTLLSILFISDLYCVHHVVSLNSLLCISQHLHFIQSSDYSQMIVVKERERDGGASIELINRKHFNKLICCTFSFFRRFILFISSTQKGTKSKNTYMEWRHYPHCVAARASTK